MREVNMKRVVESAEEQLKGSFVITDGGYLPEDIDNLVQLARKCGDMIHTNYSSENFGNMQKWFQEV